MIDLKRHLTDSSRYRRISEAKKRLEEAINEQNLTKYMKHGEIIQNETREIFEKAQVKRKEHEDSIKKLQEKVENSQLRLIEIRTKLVQNKDLSDKGIKELKDEYRTIRINLSLLKESVRTLNDKIRAIDEVIYNFTKIDYNNDTLRYHIEERLKQILKTKLYGDDKDLVSIISHTITNNPENLNDLINRVSHNLWAILMKDMGIDTLSINIDVDNPTYGLVRGIIARETNKIVFDVTSSLSKYINRRLIRKRKVSEEDFKTGLEIYDIVSLALKEAQKSKVGIKDMKMPNLEEFKREIRGMYSNPLHYIIEQVRYGEYQYVPRISMMYHKIRDEEYYIKDKISELDNEGLSKKEKEEKRRVIYQTYQDNLEKILGDFEIYGSYRNNENKELFVNPYTEYSGALFKKGDEHKITIAHEIIHYLLHKLKSEYASDEFTVEKLATILHSYFSPEFAERLVQSDRAMERKIQSRNPKKPEISIGIKKGIDYGNRPWLSKKGYVEGMYAGLNIIRLNGRSMDVIIREIAKMIS